MCVHVCVSVCVHIHNAFASNELISVTILLLYTDSPFRLSLLILLSWEKRTFSQTIMTLSVSILHIRFSPFFAYPTTISLLDTPEAFKSNFTPHHFLLMFFFFFSKGLAFPEQCRVNCDFSQNHTQGMFLDAFQTFVQKKDDHASQMTITFHVT